MKSWQDALLEIGRASITKKLMLMMMAMVVRVRVRVRCEDDAIEMIVHWVQRRFRRK